MNQRKSLMAGLSLLLFSTIAPATAADLVAPEFPVTSQAGWINSSPLRLAELRGKVVLVEFWTFGCSNCVNTLPWLKTVAERYGSRGLVVVGVHTPEFQHERDPENVRRATKRLGINYPVMLDAESEYWRALGNLYWPAFYLVDGSGRIFAREIGELRVGTPRAARMESRIEAALAAAMPR